MSVANVVVSQIIRFEPRLTTLAARERPAADKASLKVASTLYLALTAISVLNGSGVAPEDVRREIDAIVGKLPSLVGEDTVRLDHVILNDTLVEQASKQILGSYGTNAATALKLAYSLCAGPDLTRMASMHRGPLGPLGGPTAVTLERLIGEGRSEGFMEVSMLLGEFVTAIGSGGNNTAPSPSPSSAPQGTGCAIASLAILTGAGAGIYGLSALARLLS